MFEFYSPIPRVSQKFCNILIHVRHSLADLDAFGKLVKVTTTYCVMPSSPDALQFLLTVFASMVRNKWSS